MAASSSAIPRLPQRPAGTSYFHNEFQAESERSQAFTNSLVETYSSRWQDKGTVDGIEEYVVPRGPGDKLSVMPLNVACCHVDNLTPLQVFMAIRNTRYRMMWDVRIQSANVVQAFSLHEFTFYIVWRGIGPIYSPRDATGLQSVRFYDSAGRLQAHPDFSTHKVVLGYSSVPSLPGIPDQAEGCVRANHIEGGYILEATGTGCKVLYFAKLDLGLTIPGWICNHLVGEARRCVTRLRDALKTFGVPPTLIDKHQCVAVHFLESHPDTRSLTLLATVIRPGTFSIYLDYEKMYTHGVVVTGIEGEAAAFLRIRDEVGTDDGATKRRLAVDVMAEGIGGDFRIAIEPRDKDGPDSGTGPGWW